MRALLCETSGHHEECLPPVVATLQALGVASLTYQNSEALATKGNIFDCYAETSGYAATPLRPSKSGIATLVETAHSGSYGFTYVNSLTSQVSGFWAKQGLPVLGVCHNIARLGAEKALEFLAGHPKSKLVVLGDHVKAYLLKTISSLQPDRIIIHYCVGPLTQESESVSNTDHRLRVVIPGRINFANRALRALANGIPRQLQREFDVEFAFPGGISPEDKPNFRRLFLSQKAVRILAPEYDRERLDGRHQLFSATHGDYYAHIKMGTVMLPLIKSDDTRYLTSSITSTIPLSLNAGIPLLMDHHHADVYNIPAVDLGPQQYRHFISRLEQEEFKRDLSAVRSALSDALKVARERNLRTMTEYLDTLS